MFKEQIVFKCTPTDLEREIQLENFLIQPLYKQANKRE